MTRTLYYVPHRVARRQCRRRRHLSCRRRFNDKVYNTIRLYGKRTGKAMPGGCRGFLQRNLKFFPFSFDAPNVVKGTFLSLPTLGRRPVDVCTTTTTLVDTLDGTTRRRVQTITVEIFCSLVNPYGRIYILYVRAVKNEQRANAH